MEFKDYYAVLGLERAAGPDEIKKAYRKLARKYHPDVSKEADADTRMKDVNEAYSVLGDPEKRTAYDDFSSRPQRAHGFQMPPGWNPDDAADGSADQAADLFAHLFGQAAKAKQGRRKRSQLRGADLHARIVVSLAEAYTGVTRPMSLHGSHLDSHGDLLADERTLDVRIPKGVRDGQRLRLAGQGGPGHGDGLPGDLFLEVHFAPQPGYRLEGRDVYARTPVTPWEVALGAAIDVATPTGKVQVTVPPSSQTGRKLRLKGRGIPGMHPGDMAGDLYLVLEVIVPPATSDTQRALYDRMAREMAFNPRASAGAPA